MDIEDSEIRSKPRPSHGFSETPPPGFFIAEGRSFILVAADHVVSGARRLWNAVLRRPHDAGADSDTDPSA
jgi:hypothetical protein